MWLILSLCSSRFLAKARAARWWCLCVVRCSDVCCCRGGGAAAAVRTAVRSHAATPALTTSPPPSSLAQRSPLPPYTGRFESRLVFGVEHTGATVGAPDFWQNISSFEVLNQVIVRLKCSLIVVWLHGKLFYGFLEGFGQNMTPKLCNTLLDRV